MSEQPLNSPETVEEERDLILDLFTLMSHAGFAAFVIENLAGVSLMPKDILPGATEALLV